MGDLVSLLPIIAIVVVFWLFVIAPASRRQKAARQMQSALDVGDEVVLTSGIFGTVTEVADTHLLVQLAPGVDVKVARSAIAGVVPEDYDEPETDEADHGADTDTELDTDPADGTSATDPEER